MHLKFTLSSVLLGASILASVPVSAEPARHGPAFHRAGPHRGPVTRGGFNRGWGARSHARFVFRHDFRHFTPVERSAWQAGRWRHGPWHGRNGWWWGVGGAWYFYDAPVYPYPEEVSPTYYDDSQDDESGSDYDQEGSEQNGSDDYGQSDEAGPNYGSGTWYHCSNPDGYYPYVKTCRSGWEQVPAAPQAGGVPQDNQRQMAPEQQGGPDSWPPPDGDSGPDDGPTAPNN